MARYRSLRHRRLMDESEHALHAAVDSENEYDARIAKHVTGDRKIYQVWETSHAQSVLPVAEQSKGAFQILELRELETKLVHQRALIEHIRGNRIRDEERKRVFGLFYGPRDFQNAVLAEHRQYTLAMSSRVSADHLIGIMHDPKSLRLLKQYEAVFKRYFAMSCYMLKAQNEIYFESIKPIYENTADALQRVKARLRTEKPAGKLPGIGKQAVLAQTGRCSIRNYMVG